MEYIAIATGPNHGLYTVTTRKQKRTLLNANSGESIKCGNVKNDVELWYKLHPATFMRKEQKEKEQESETGYVGFKKGNESIAYQYQSKEEKGNLIKDHTSWDYGFFKDEKEVLDWTGCKELGVKRITLQIEDLFPLEIEKQKYKAISAPAPFALDPIELPKKENSTSILQPKKIGDLDLDFFDTTERTIGQPPVLSVEQIVAQADDVKNHL